MSLVRVYRATVSTRPQSDEEVGAAVSYEAHFTAVRRGDIRKIREQLADRAIPYFQRTVEREYGITIPKAILRIRFEREEPALASSPDVHADFRRMEFKGRIHRATSGPSIKFRFAKRRRRNVRSRSRTRGPRDRARRKQRGKGGSTDASCR